MMIGSAQQPHVSDTGNVLVSFKNCQLRQADGITSGAINFQIKEGEHLALVGENDALKNALLGALTGEVTITGGEKHFYLHKEAGIIVEANVIKRLRKPIIAITNRHHFKSIDGNNNFYYQQRFNSCSSEDSATVEEYLAAVEQTMVAHFWTLTKIAQELKLAPLLSKRHIMLSNGETKRVLIAAALLQHPVLLVLQNPLTGLDVSSRSEITNLINEVANAGTTIVMTSSSGELPAAINTLAVIEKSNTISLVPRARYIFQTSIQPSINETLVKELVNQTLPVFDTIVQMNEVHIQYGERVILDNINWTIKQGERWVLSGENGAGKSTLLSLINGDNPQAFANDIILFDRKKGSGESIWDIKQKTGFFSPELYQYFPVDTSCLQAVESGFFDTIGLFRPSNPKRAATAMQWMRVLGIDAYANKLLRNVPAVSQRLSLLARAFVKNPVLLILDEPCQGFDEQQTANFKALINLVCANSNMTMIYVSHYPHEIPASIHKMYRLHNGRQVT